MKHGSWLNPFGNHRDDWQGLRPEFRGDHDAGQWLARELLSRAEKGFDRVGIHNLFGGLRHRAVPMLSPAHATPAKWRAIQQAFRVVCNRHKGITIDLYCAVRSHPSQDIATIRTGITDDQEPWLTDEAMQVRREAWQPIIDAVEQPSGRIAFTLDDGRKMPDVAARIVNEFPGIEINVEPPMAVNDATNTPSWSEYAMKIGGFAEQSWARHMLLSGLKPEPGQPTVRLWWTAAMHREFGMAGLERAIADGYGIYDDTRLPEVERLLTEGRN